MVIFKINCVSKIEKLGKLSLLIFLAQMKNNISALKCSINFRMKMSHRASGKLHKKFGTS